MKIHNRIVSTLVLVDLWICMQTNNEEVSVLLSLLEEIKMSNVEKIKCAGNVDNFIALFWTLTVAELYQLLSGRQELTRAGPR